MTYTVLVADNVDKAALAVLNAAPDLTVIAAGQMTREQVIQYLPEADALVIRSATQCDAEMLSHATKLKVIARAGVGVDNVDLNVATNSGIVVMNTPDGNTISTAEFTFGLMLAIARHIPASFADMQQGRWERKAFTGLELKGKTLGIVGFGRIGRAVAVRARAFEMTVLTADPFVSAESAAEYGATLVDLDTLYAQSDFITLHSIINDDTRGMINAESIAKMKKGVRIINAARGALIVDADLAAAIQSGHVAAAALDVYQPEPPTADNPLINLKNVLHTPHLAASTSDAQINVGVDAARLIVDALVERKYANVCNPAIFQDRD